MSPQAKAQVRGTATRITLPSGEASLTVEITIACDLCGSHRLILAGHHLKAIRNLLVEFVDLHPTLCGPEPTDPVRERLTGTTADPTQN